MKYLPTLLANLFITCTLFAHCGNSYAEKPNIWVITNICHIEDKHPNGQPKMNPDDLVSLASLLLYADNYHIENIVVGSKNEPIQDPLPFVEELFNTSYSIDTQGMRKSYPGFQHSIRFEWSAITKDGNSIKFNSEDDYYDISSLESITALKHYAQQNKVYVLIWGELTEPAILVKHLLSTGNLETLQNIRFISHWTKSHLTGFHRTVLAPSVFDAANCNNDINACKYLSKITKEIDAVKFIELGATGQLGLVDGSRNFPNLRRFDNSLLGQILVRAQLHEGAPDQSDAATHWVLSGNFGLSLSDFSWDGTISSKQESHGTKTLFRNAHKILNALLERSDAANANHAYSGRLNKLLSYSYQKKGEYAIYSTEKTKYKIYDKRTGRFLQKGSLAFGYNRISLPEKEHNFYDIILDFPGYNLELSF